MNSIFYASLSTDFISWIDQQSYSRLYFIADEHTNLHCLPLFLSKTGLTQSYEIVVVAPGESQKNLTTCQIIWRSMLEAKLDRKALVINLGGGVICDMGGFCAATWKRGIDFIQVPTTLLAMTDAAIGGKTGVDFSGIKNIIGAFRQPAAVFIDTDFLQTLPEREYKSGFAEVIKHLHISGAWKNVPEMDWETPSNYLQDSIAVKLRIVTEDPLEQGLRSLLNFGHTIGHALESWSLETSSPLTHGEAIAIGMLCELEPSSQREKLLETVSKSYPHRLIPESAFGSIWERMQHDKKNSGGAVNCVLPGEKPFTLRVERLDWEEFYARALWYNALIMDTRFNPSLQP